MGEANNCIGTLKEDVRDTDQRLRDAEAVAEEEARVNEEKSQKIEELMDELLRKDTLID